MRETITIMDWSLLSEELGIAGHIKDRIMIDKKGEQSAQQQAFIKAWFDTGNASWAALHTALRSDLVGKIEVANVIAEKHPSTR